MLGDHGPQRLSLAASVNVKPLRTARPKEGDSGEHLVRRLLSIAWQLRETTIARRLLELVDRLDAQGLVNPEDPRRRHAGHMEHLEQSLGRCCPELLEIERLPVLDEIAHDRERRWSE